MLMIVNAVARATCRSGSGNMPMPFHVMSCGPRPAGDINNNSTNSVVSLALSPQSCVFFAKRLKT